jgi:hypothetical protein
MLFSLRIVLSPNSEAMVSNILSVFYNLIRRVILYQERS